MSLFKRKKIEKKNIVLSPEEATRLVEESERIRKAKRENFLEGILRGVREDFEEYESGYRVTSIKIQDINYEPDIKTLSEITNRISERYKCKLNSFSVSETSMSGKTYFFMFEK